MRIDYQWGQSPKSKSKTLPKWFKRLFTRAPVPLHMSSHYRRESFHDDGSPRLF